MISLHPVLNPISYPDLTNPNIFIGLLAAVVILIEAFNYANRNKSPLDNENKKLKGKFRLLQEEADSTIEANDILQRDNHYWRSVAEERKQQISSLEKELKSSSFYQHHLERKLLNKSQHRL